MERVPLGKTGIHVSPLGIGTGSSGFSGRVFQSDVPPAEYAQLLVHAYGLGINFWDTAYTYGTYPHLAGALKQLNRKDIVIMTKFSSAGYRETRREIEESLKALATDYLDVGLLHGLRNRFEYRIRRPALRALLEAKERGQVRCIGLSSHGVGALETALEDPRMEMVLARINPEGVAMDSDREGVVSKLVAIPPVQRLVTRLIPKRVMPSLSAAIEPARLTPAQQETVIAVLEKFKSKGKPVVGMKVLGAGKLTDQRRQCIAYVKGLNCVTAMVVGMVSKAELEENIKLFETSPV